MKDPVVANEGGCSDNGEKCMCLFLSLPPHFSLQKAVCSYGFFMTAPNSWVASATTPTAATSGFLERPLRLLDGRAVSTRISESNDKLHICVRGIHLLSDADADHLLTQISRMLRLSEHESSSIAAFHSLHLQAKENGFGRLFRSPTLFEDMIKSLLLCNCGWGRTLTMARALCELQAELKGPPLGYCEKNANQLLWPATPESREMKRKHRSKKKRYSKSRRLLKLDKTCEGRTLTVEVVGGDLENQENIPSAPSAAADVRESDVPLPGVSSSPCPVMGAFPTPEELCGLHPKVLAKRCGLGYRADSISKLAKDICNGNIALQSLESAEGEPSLRVDAREKLMQIRGFGPFTSANVLMCMGEYGDIPADTETVRHLKQVHGMSECSAASVSEDAARLYAPYAPYQFLSYWFELWASYEQRFGKLSSMDPRFYSVFTGPKMRSNISMVGT